MRYSRFACVGGALFAFAGCVITTPTPGPVPGYPTAPVPAPAPTVLDAVSREVARNAINAEISKRYPGINVAPYTNCVVNNASSDELIGIAQAARGNSVDLSQRITTIVTRPTTTQCIASAAQTT